MMLRFAWFRNLQRHVLKLPAMQYTSKCLASQPDYHTFYRRSIDKPIDFWDEMAEQIHWFKKWDKTLVGNDHHARWYIGGLMNTCYNCIDRHVQEGHGEQAAIIYESPVTNTCRTLSYDELLKEVSLLAGALAHHCRVRIGDRVLIYMPMIPECLIAMLACARIGAIHSVVFGGFSDEQLASRIIDAKPRVLITASYGVEPTRLVDYKLAVDKAIQQTSSEHVIERCILFNRPNLPEVDLSQSSKYLNWEELITKARAHDAVPVDANHPLYILYTSGTTGMPKGLVRPNGGNAVALQFSMAHVFGIQPGECWWACSEFGWVVGHSYCAYGPLLHRNTTVLYEGKPVGTPDAAQYFRVLSQHNVSGWLLTPSAVRAIRREDPQMEQSKTIRTGPGALKSLKSAFLVGEHCDVATISWLQRGLPAHVQVSDHWWQTESGWPITASCVGLRNCTKQSVGIVSPPGSAGRPVPGFDLQLLDQVEDSEEEAVTATPQSQVGDSDLKRLVVKLPLPPGIALTIWGNDQKFYDYYFRRYPGYYDTMDVGYQDAEGFVHIQARADDIINVSGHRLSTSAIEEACYMDKDVIDCAVIAVPDEIKGHLPYGLLVKRKTSKKTDKEIIKSVVSAVRQHVGPVAAFKLVSVVPALPKTRSGKTARPSLANMAAGKPIKIPPTIEDDSVYKPIYEAFKSNGLCPTCPP